MHNAFKVFEILKKNVFLSNLFQHIAFTVLIKKKLRTFLAQVCVVISNCLVDNQV